MVITRENKYGLVGTTVVHVGILLMLIFIGFTVTLPAPEDGGIMVNFGDSETGLGDIEPSPAVAQEEPTVTEKQEDIPAVKPKTPPAVKEKPKPVKEEVVTQDAEKTAAIEAAKKQKKEADRLKQIEADKLRREEMERERIAAEAKKKQEEENRKIADINSRTKGAFGKTGGGTGGTGNGTGTSQGVTFPGGNQGVPTGDPNATTYGPGGGTGTSGSGVSYNLSGRTATSTPKPNFPGKEDGIVVVKITVDRNGRVTSAEPGQPGTSTMNPNLHDAAKRAAMQAKFNVKEDAPAFQTGTITYRFIIQSQ